MTKFLILPFILVGCTAPITDPPAHACSPSLDGEPTNCPEPDVVCLSLDCPKLLPREELRGELDVLNVHQWNDIHHMFIRNQRREQIEKNMTLPADAINNALAEFNYGSYDTTEQKELLQLSSDGD
jgi:hypothetical protein